MLPTFDVVRLMPRAWRTSVTITHPGEKTWDGDDTPGESVTEDDWVVVPGRSAAPRDKPSDWPDTDAAAYAHRGSAVRAGDTVTVPAPHPLAGAFDVVADPGRWPLGVEVPLRRSQA